MNNNFKLPTEWLKQAEYDMDTAKAMLKTGRYIYAVYAICSTAPGSPVTSIQK